MLRFATANAPCRLVGVIELDDSTVSAALLSPRSIASAATPPQFHVHYKFSGGLGIRLVSYVGWREKGKNEKYG